MRYVFWQGHLAKVLVAYTAEAAAAAEYVRDDLSKRFGEPRVFHPATGAPPGIGQRANNAQQRDLEASAALVSILAAVTGMGATTGKGGNWNWDFNHQWPATSASAPTPGTKPPATAKRDVGDVKDADARDLNRLATDYLGAPLEELAYAQWLTRETVVAWAAHEWRPELLVTSFASRVLLDAANASR